MKTKICILLAVEILNLGGFIAPAFAQSCGSPAGSGGPSCDECSQPNPPCECTDSCDDPDNKDKDKKDDGKKDDGRKEGQVPKTPTPPKPPKDKELPPPPPPPIPTQAGVSLDYTSPSCKKVTLQTEPVTPSVSQLCNDSDRVQHTSTIGFTYNAICLDSITNLSASCSYQIGVVVTSQGLLSNPAIPSANALRLQMLATGQFNTITTPGLNGTTNTTTPGLNTTTNTTTSDGSTTTTTTTTQNEDGTYTLSGTVIGGDTQAGVGGIEVTLLSGGSAVIGSTTDASGNFVITGIQGTGTYQVKAVDIRSVDTTSKYFFGIVDLPITQKNSTVKLEGIANTSSNKGVIDAVTKLSTTNSTNSPLSDWLDGLFGNKNTNGNGVNDTGTNSTTNTGGLSNATNNGNGLTSNGLTSNSLISLLNNGFTLEGNGLINPLNILTNIGPNAGAICGNGILETSESCDDGRNNGKSGYCSADCKYFGEVRTNDSSLGSDSLDGGTNTTSNTITNKFTNLTNSLFNALSGNKEQIKKDLSQVNLEISTLDAEINTKTVERTAIENDLIQSKADLAEVQKEILQYTTERDALLQSIQSREAMIESLKETLATLKPNSPEAKKIVSEIAALEKLNESEKAQVKVLESKIALAKVKESQLIDKITQVTKKLNNINNEIKQLTDKREKAVSKRDALIKQLNGNIVSNGITSLFSILGTGINRVTDAASSAQTWSKKTIIAHTSPETRKVMKQVAVVTKEVAKYSVIGVTCLLGAAAVSLNIMVFKTQWKAYTIADGETFDSIGSKFNMTERAIRRRNGIAKNKGLRQGMKIKVRNRAFIEKDYLDQLKSVLSDSLKTRDHGDAMAKIQKFFKK